MKKRQKQTYRDKSVSELLKLIRQKKLELSKLSVKGTEEKNIDKKRQLRHEVAFLLTVIRQKGVDEPLVSLKSEKETKKEKKTKKTEKSVKKVKKEA